MTDLDERGISTQVTAQQVAEYRGELLAAGLMLSVLLVAAVIAGTLPAALLLGGCLIVTAVLGSRDPFTGRRPLRQPPFSPGVRRSHGAESYHATRGFRCILRV